LDIQFHFILGADESMPNEGEIEKRFENLLVGFYNYNIITFSGSTLPLMSTIIWH
jgi:hypothetical protein